MANPYDFTSGYLSARSLKESERKNQADELFRKEVMGPYYQSAARENDAKAALYGVHRRNAILEGNTKRAKGIDDLGWDPLGDYTDANPFGFSYPANPAGGLKVPPLQFNDGTVGGLRVSNDPVAEADAGGQIAPPARQQAIQRQPVAPVVAGADPSTTAAAPQPNAAPMRDPVNLLKDENPRAANAIAMNFFTAPMKDIPKMLDRVSKWDLFEGKISSKDVLANVQAMKQMQNEGVAQAMSLALQGNKKAALKLFSQIGSDLGEDVVDLSPIKIKNPVASAVKGVQDEYEGVKITYKDGSTMNWDPRKFLISTASLKEYLTSKDSVENNLRSQAVQKYGDDVRAESNKVARETNAQHVLMRLEDQAINRLTGEAKSELTRLTSAFLDSKNPNFIADADQREVKNRQIEAQLRPALDVAVQNVTLFGNRGATMNGVMQAMQSQQPAIGQDGKPVTEVKGGQRFVKMASGVWLPVTGQ